MLTTHEKRFLYVLKKHGNRAKHSQISQAMQRVPTEDRLRAITNCEDLELISSARTPSVKGKARGSGGREGLVYWLTDEGIDLVQGLIDSGDMQDPLTEPRAGNGGRNAND